MLTKVAQVPALHPQQQPKTNEPLPRQRSSISKHHTPGLTAFVFSLWSEGNHYVCEVMFPWSWRHVGK